MPSPSLPHAARRPLLEPLEARLLLTVSVNGIVWGDLDSSGVRDAGEPGIAGAVVEVFSSTDTTIGNADDVSRGMAVTAASGSYAFGGLASDG